MKQVSMGVVAVVLVGALLAGFLLGRLVGKSQRSHEEAAVANTATSEVAADRNASSVVDGRSSGSDDGEATPLTPATPANTATGSAGKAAAMKRSRRTSGGPQSLREEDAALLKKWDARFRSIGGSSADWLDLLDNEEQDESARQLEQLIAQAIRVHGDGLTDLRMSPPRCTRSVCGFRAVGPGGGAIPVPDPNKPTGFSKLMADIGKEPWFTSSFDNMQSSMSVDGDQMVYLAMFLRCEPGTCRGGRG